MQLKQFQNNQVDQARIQAVSGAPSRAPSALSFVADSAFQIGGAVTGAIADSRTAQADSLKAQKMGSLSQTLAGIAEASATTPGYDYAQNLRRVHQQALADNPEMALEINKLFKDTTGVNPAGESQESIEARERTKRAEDANWINAYMTDEERAEGERKYYEFQAEEAALTAKLTRLNTLKSLGELGDEEATQLVYGEMSNIVNMSYDKLQDNLTVWKRRFDEGGPEERKALLAEIRQAKLAWGVAKSSFGTMAVDGIGAQMIKPNDDLFAYAERYVQGLEEADAYEGYVKQQRARANAVLYSNPEDVADIVSSEAYQFAPSVKIEMNVRAAKARNRTASTLQGMSSQDADDLAVTFTNMANAADNPAAQIEATQATVAMIDEFDRNGDLFTEDDKLNAMRVFSDPALWADVPPEDKNKMVEAFKLHMADDVAPALRKLQQENLNGMRTRITASENGLRIVPADGAMLNRPQQLRLRKANQGLAKWNNTLRTISNAEGISIDEAAARYFGVNAADEAQQEAERAGPPEPQMGFGSSLANLADRAQQAVFGDNASADRIAAREEAARNPVGQGTVLAPEATESVTEAPTATPEPAPEPEPEFDAMTGATAKAEEAFIDNVVVAEGEGDNVTDVVTGKAGVTAAALNAINYPEKDPTKLTEEQSRDVVRQYTAQLDADFTQNLAGYSDLPREAKFAILDAGYNLGPGIKNFSKFKQAVAEGNTTEAMRQLLDTASAKQTASGKSKALRGLAVRRAQLYNKVAQNPITEVEQYEDGTLEYRDVDGNIILKYRPAGGRHPDSGVGVLKVG